MSFRAVVCLPTASVGCPAARTSSYHVRVLSKLFKRLFLEALQAAFDAAKLQFFHSLEPLREAVAFARQLDKLKACDWVVYAKQPFAGPQQVLDYVGRYTHRVAISNNRLLDIAGNQVQFKWKDYRDGGQVKTMTVSADEFIRRFLMHVMPNGFHRIRYYGFLGNRCRNRKLTECRRLLGMCTENIGKRANRKRNTRSVTKNSLAVPCANVRIASRAKW